MRELSQRDDLIRVLTVTRDQAFATLQRHGLTIPTQLPNKEKEETVSAHLAGDLQHLPPEERIIALVEKNENLREVIRQMRNDMEDISSQLATRLEPSVTMQSKEEESEISPPLTKGEFTIFFSVHKLAEFNRSCNWNKTVHYLSPSPLKRSLITKVSFLFLGDQHFCW